MFVLQHRSQFARRQYADVIKEQGENSRDYVRILDDTHLPEVKQYRDSPGPMRTVVSPGGLSFPHVEIQEVDMQLNALESPIGLTSRGGFSAKPKKSRYQSKGGVEVNTLAELQEREKKIDRIYGRKRRTAGDKKFSKQLCVRWETQFRGDIETIDKLKSMASHIELDDLDLDTPLAERRRLQSQTMSLIRGKSPSSFQSDGGRRRSRRHSSRRPSSIPSGLVSPPNESNDGSNFPDFYNDVREVESKLVERLNSSINSEATRSRKLRRNSSHGSMLSLMSEDGPDLRYGAGGGIYRDGVNVRTEKNTSSPTLPAYLEPFRSPSLMEIGSSPRPGTRSKSPDSPTKRVPISAPKSILPPLDETPKGKGYVPKGEGRHGRARSPSPPRQQMVLNGPNGTILQFDPSECEYIVEENEDDMDYQGSTLSPTKSPFTKRKYTLAPLSVQGVENPYASPAQTLEITVPTPLAMGISPNPHVSVEKRYLHDPAAGFGDYYIMSPDVLKFSKCKYWGCKHKHAHWVYKMIKGLNKLGYVRDRGDLSSDDEAPTKVLPERHTRKASSAFSNPFTTGKGRGGFQPTGRGFGGVTKKFGYGGGTSAASSGGPPVPVHRTMSSAVRASENQNRLARRNSGFGMQMDVQEVLLAPLQEKVEDIHKLNGLSTLAKNIKKKKGSRKFAKYERDNILNRRGMEAEVLDEEDVLRQIMLDEDSDEEKDSPFRYKPVAKRKMSFEGDKLEVDKYFYFHHKYNYEPKPSDEQIPHSVAFTWDTTWRPINNMDVKEAEIKRRHSFHGMKEVKKNFRMRRRHSISKVQYQEKQLYMVERVQLPALNMRALIPDKKDQVYQPQPPSPKKKPEMTQAEVAEARRALLSKVDRSGLAYKMRGRTIVVGHVEYVDFPVFDNPGGLKPKSETMIWPHNESPPGLFDPPKYLIFVVESEAEINGVKLEIGDQYDIDNPSGLPILSPMFTQYLDLDIDITVKTIRIKTVVKWDRRNMEEVPPSNLLDLLYVLGVDEEDDVFDEDDKENFLNKASRLTTQIVLDANFFFRKHLSNGSLVLKTYLLDGCLLTDEAIIVRQVLRCLIPEERHWSLLNLTRKAIKFLNANSKNIMSRPFLVISKFMIDFYGWTDILNSMGYPKEEVFSTMNGKSLVRRSMTTVCEYGMVFEFVTTNPSVQFSAAKAIFDLATENRVNRRSSVDNQAFVDKRPGLRIGIDYLLEEGYCIRVGQKRIGLFGLLMAEFQFSRYIIEDSLLSDDDRGHVRFFFCDARAWSDRLGYITSLYSVSNASLLVSEKRLGCYEKSNFTYNTVEEFIHLIKADALACFFIMKSTRRLIIDGAEYFSMQKLMKIIRMYKKHANVLEYYILGDSYHMEFDDKKKPLGFAEKVMAERGLPTGYKMQDLIPSLMTDVFRCDQESLVMAIKFFNVPISMQQLIDKSMVMYEERVAARLEGQLQWYTSPRPPSEKTCYKQLKHLPKWAPEQLDSVNFCETLEDVIKHYMSDSWNTLIFVSEYDQWWTDYTQKIFTNEEARYKALIPGRRVWSSKHSRFYEIKTIINPNPDVTDVDPDTILLCADQMKKEVKVEAYHCYPFLVIPFSWAQYLSYRVHNVIMFVQPPKNGKANASERENCQTIYQAVSKATRKLILTGDKSRWSKILSTFSHQKMALADFLNSDHPIDFPPGWKESDLPLPPDEMAFSDNLKKSNAGKNQGAGGGVGKVDDAVLAILNERKRKAEEEKMRQRREMLEKAKAKGGGAKAGEDDHLDELMNQETPDV